MTQKLIFPKATCAICGVEFIKTRSNRICCSKDCAKLLWSRRKGKQYFRELYKSDPQRFIRYQQSHRAKLKDTCYSAYGGYRCACLHCTETNPKFLTLDHIKNDGYELRKVHGDGDAFYRWLIKNDFPPIVQVLCYNCNCGKNVNGGICPHIGEYNARN